MMPRGHDVLPYVGDLEALCDAAWLDLTWPALEVFARDHQAGGRCDRDAVDAVTRVLLQGLPRALPREDLRPFLGAQPGSGHGRLPAPAEGLDSALALLKR